jgi:flagellar basal-body rod modification protein FlgD
MQLLIAEMQNQDPLQPQDPTQMVSQLVQLEMLDVLLSIQQELSGGTPASQGQTKSPGGRASAGQPTGGS